MSLKYKRVCGIAAVVLLACIYGLFGFHPFNWQSWPTQHFKNGVVRTADTGLHFQSPGIAHTVDAPEWIPAVTVASSLQLLLEVRADSRVQFGPARIFSISRNPYLRNLTVGQEGVDLVIRIRTPSTNLNGTPQYIIGGVFSTSGWHKIEITITQKSLNILVDGEEVRNSYLPENALAQWSPYYNLALGNEFTSNRAWLGSIRKVVVNVGNKSIDYLDSASLYIPPDLTIPDRYFKMPSYQLMPFTKAPINKNVVRDWVVNLFGFVPLGLLIASICKTKRMIISVLVVSASLSITIELGQLYLPSRHTSVDDFFLNTMGGIIGAWLAVYHTR